MPCAKNVTILFEMVNGLVLEIATAESAVGTDSDSWSDTFDSSAGFCRAVHWLFGGLDLCSWPWWFELLC